MQQQPSQSEVLKAIVDELSTAVENNHQSYKKICDSLAERYLAEGQQCREKQRRCGDYLDTTYRQQHQIKKLSLMLQTLPQQIVQAGDQQAISKVLDQYNQLVAELQKHCESREQAPTQQKIEAEVALQTKQQLQTIAMVPISSELKLQENLSVTAQPQLTRNWQYMLYAERALILLYLLWLLKLATVFL